MADGDITQVVVVGRLHGQVTNNVLNFKHISPAGTLTELIDAVIDCIRTSLLQALSNEWTLIQVKARTIHPVAGDEVFVQGAATDVGGLGESLPSYACALVAVKTGLGGRSKRGRFFLAGIPESQHSQSSLVPGEVVFLVNFCLCMAGKFIPPNQTLPFVMGVLSRKLKPTGVNVDSSAFFFPATKLTVNTVLSTLHSRKIGVGV